MAALDTLLDSRLLLDVEARLVAASGAGANVRVMFSAVELAAKTALKTEDEVIELIAGVSEKKQWDAKINFGEQLVEFKLLTIGP